MALGTPLSPMAGGGWTSAGSRTMPQSTLNAGPPVSQRTQQAPASGTTPGGVADLLNQFGPTPNRGAYPGMAPGTQPGAPAPVGSFDWMLQQMQAQTPEGQANAMSEWLRNAMGQTGSYYDQMSQNAARQGQLDFAYYDANGRYIGANADLARRGLGLDRQNAGAQLGLLERDNSRQRELAGQRNAVQQWLATQLGGHNTSDRDLRMRDIALQLFNQDRSLRSSATARGAYNAPGLGINLQAVNDQADIHRGQANVSHDRTRDQLSAGSQLDNVAYQTALANLANQLAQGRQGYQYTIGQQDLAGEQIGLNAGHAQNQNAYAGDRSQQAVAEQLARLATQRNQEQLGLQQTALSGPR